MATWAARASTKGSGQTSLTARLRDDDGPSKSPPLLALVAPTPLPLPLPSWEDEDEEEEEEEEEEEVEEDIYKK